MIKGLEEANKSLLNKVVNHRKILRSLLKVHVKDLYDKDSRCRLCNKICKKRVVPEHDPLCVWVIAVVVPKTNKDLKEFNHKRLFIKLKKIGQNPTWVEQVVLKLIDLLDYFNHKRTINAMVKFLELNDLLVYRQDMSNIEFRVDK